MNFLHRRLVPGLALIFAGLPGGTAYGLPEVPAGHPAVGEMAPVERESPTRATICLNGTWLFQPALDEQSPPQEGWGLARVPASWSDDRFDKEVQSGLLARGESPAWQDFSTARNSPTSTVWYQRPVTIPEDWQGGRLELELLRVSTDAKVWVNGREAGEIRWPGGSVEIGGFVEPGTVARLDLMVVSNPGAAEKVVFMDHFDVQKSKARVHSRGLIGDVFLRWKPAGPRLAGTVVFPSLTKGGITVRSWLAEEPADTAGYQLSMKATDAEGRSVEFPAQSLKVAPGPDGSPQGEVFWTWENPILWQPDNPHLYQLEMTLRDADGMVLDTTAIRTGFREVTLRGRELLLNGVPTRLRPMTAQFDKRSLAQIENEIRQAKASGYNFIQLWPNDPIERGHFKMPEWILEVADREGMLISGVFPNFHTYRWKDPSKTRADFLPDALAILRELGNHPSLILWATTPNSYGHNDDQDPRYLGRRGWIPDGDPALTKNGREDALKMIEELRVLDPSRPIFTHHGTDVGDIHTLNWYPNWTPLQEQREALSQWTRDGNMPFIAVEYDAPSSHSFARGRAGHGQADSTEPWITEYAAMVLGPEVYSRESKAYRDSYVRSFSGTPFEHKFRGSEDFIHNGELARETIAAWLGQTLPAFRAWGATGVIPWALRLGWKTREAEIPWTPGMRGEFRPVEKLREPLPTAVRETVERFNRPVMAWIGGGATFTEDSRNVFPGETVQRQMVLINDVAKEADFRGRWALTSGEKELAAGDFTQRVPAGSTGFVPVEFALPANLEGGPITLALRATANDEELTAEQTLHVIPKPDAEKKIGPVTVLDPSGSLAVLLEKAGIDFALFENLQEIKNNVLLAGPGALDQVSPGELEDFVSSGGRLLLLSPALAQLQQWGFRTAAIDQRRYWPVGSVAAESGSPVAELPAEWLANWRGAATSREAYPVSLGRDIPRSPRGYPIHGWRWGNNSLVSAHAVEKPSRAGWTPLIEGGFDLSYSPLLELHHGRGLVLLSTFDLAGRVTSSFFPGAKDPEPVIEPAAVQVLRHMVEYALGAEPAQPRRMARPVGSQAEEFVKTLGLVPASPEAPPERELLVVGDGKNFGLAELDQALEAGANVLLLPRSDEGLEALGLKVRGLEFAAAQPVPSWPEARGVSAAELRLRAEVPIRAAVSGEGWEVGAGGLLARREKAGRVAILCQLTPDMLQANEKSYLHLSQFRLTRLWSQLAANLGAGFLADTALFQPAPQEPISLAGEWEFAFAEPLPQRSGSDPSHPYEPPAEKATPTPPTEGWQRVTLPGMWESFAPDDPESMAFDGTAWFRCTFDLAHKPDGMEIELGRIDDFDVVYVNGHEVGRTGPEGRNTSRKYSIPANLLQPGSNEILVRVFDQKLKGGFAGKPEDMMLRPTTTPLPSPYAEGFVETFEIGDDPYRYYRW